MDGLIMAKCSSNEVFEAGYAISGYCIRTNTLHFRFENEEFEVPRGSVKQTTYKGWPGCSLIQYVREAAKIDARIPAGLLSGVLRTYIPHRGRCLLAVHAFRYAEIHFHASPGGNTFRRPAWMGS